MSWTKWLFRVILFGQLLAMARPSVAQDASSPSNPRPPWTNSRVKGSPEPPLPFVTERVYPQLKFNQCLHIATTPSINRFFVVEQSGKVFSVPYDQSVDQADLAIDLHAVNPEIQQTYAIAFHPKFEENRYCYICYIKAADLPDGTRIARYKVTESDPPTIDPASEATIISWVSGGHNGCDLKFGPDGFLYISTGDATPPSPPDELRTGQDVSDLLSSILRIDVDQTSDGKNYKIPDDNPFIAMEGVCPEIWAYGFRNPWRMSFDSKTGDFWVGDVGWELREMLQHVERGGNYGWAVMEGSLVTNPNWPRGPTPILPPTIEHEHSESSSITDGLTYYGNRLPQLHGHHVYGDYDTGKLWAFRYENGQVVYHREIADSTLRIVGFGEQHDGEMLIIDHIAGTLHRLVPNPEENLATQFPRQLSDTGIFASVPEQAPSDGVLGYSIVAEPWADYATAQRFVGVPGDEAIRPGGRSWTFPDNSVLVKTLSLDMRQGDPTSRRFVETQVLHFDGGAWRPYTYRWNDEQTDATLVGNEGAEQRFDVADQNAPGGVRRQTWRFYGRAECQRCHNPWSGPPLAFNAVQLNTASLSDPNLDQLAAFASATLLSRNPRESNSGLVDPYDTAQPIDSRARSYLHTNCGHCHRNGAGGSVVSLMHYDLELSQMQLVGAKPMQGAFGILEAQVVAAGDPYRSALFHRVSKTGSGRMPRIGSAEVDQQGVDLLHDWILQLDSQDDPESQLAAQRTLEANKIKQLVATRHERERVALLSELLGHTSSALQLLHAIDQGQISPSAQKQIVTTAAKHSDGNIRDLFERFVPVEDRVRRLGSSVDPTAILSLEGDGERGKSLFLEAAAVACRNCHQIGTQGKHLGPDLSKIAEKLSREQILESILEPSKRIDPK
ncbi:MAG: PQQ-dependent sugar dehydrogenase, partial [Planctomycetales bacterium]|nr:PQQ-dependent sugar dehydrogenase [Planctomycetales bacterium]